MKYGLVLSGGGSKGAYESGCMKALQELGYHFDIVTGTSIGALNGLLVAQEDYQKLYTDVGSQSFSSPPDTVNTGI